MYAKKPTKLDLLLNILSDHEWHSGDELASSPVGWRFGAVIHEARGRGYQIKTDRQGRKGRYRLPKF